ncbi:MAG: 50S ribosomal protein L3 [Chitinivibrionales bacterium]|nr:50S ribosomal protein L3 [Chitinivibrionales bacterium]MBD3356227.1 50S ribosomal protein L3 [Chitinivibrionales bacterium]
MQGLIGKKIGMTRLFDEETGRNTPVTIIQAGTNVVHQVKTEDRDGYSAVQLGFGTIPDGKVCSPLEGHFRKHGSVPTRVVKEIEPDSAEEKVEPGQKMGVEVFEGVEYVDVTGTSKGHGFAGTVKRHGFRRGRETHGNKNHRERGSLGAGTFPARVFPGLKMAGHFGAKRVTIKRLQVFGIDKESGLMFLRGAVPGPRKGIVLLRKTKKN